MNYKIISEFIKDISFEIPSLEAFALLEKEISKLESGLKTVSGKLDNKKFMEKAPEEVVSKEREKEQSMIGAMQALKQKLNQLGKV